MPRSAIIWTRSRELSLKARYHLTHRMMISWSKCRPLNRSCAEVGSVIPAVIAGYRAFQQFAPEPRWLGGVPLTGHCATPKDSPGISHRDVGTSDSSLSRVLNPYEFGYRHLA